MKIAEIITLYMMTRSTTFTKTQKETLRVKYQQRIEKMYASDCHLFNMALLMFVPCKQP